MTSTKFGFGISYSHDTRTTKEPKKISKKNRNGDHWWSKIAFFWVTLMYNQKKSQRKNLLFASSVGRRRTREKKTFFPSFSHILYMYGDVKIYDFCILISVSLISTPLYKKKNENSKKNMMTKKILLYPEYRNGLIDFCNSNIYLPWNNIFVRIFLLLKKLLACVCIVKFNSM